jgi:hypothetical protein
MFIALFALAAPAGSRCADSHDYAFRSHSNL